MAITDNQTVSQQLAGSIAKGRLAGVKRARATRFFDKWMSSATNPRTVRGKKLIKPVLAQR